MSVRYSECASVALDSSMQSTCACLALPQFFPTLSHNGMVGGVTARELQYPILVFGTHRGDTFVPSLNIAAVIMIIIAVSSVPVLVLS